MDTNLKQTFIWLACAVVGVLIITMFSCTFQERGATLITGDSIAMFAPEPDPYTYKIAMFGMDSGDAIKYMECWPDTERKVERIEVWLGVADRERKTREEIYFNLAKLRFYLVNRYHVEPIVFDPWKVASVDDKYTFDGTHLNKAGYEYVLSNTENFTIKW